MEESLDEIEDGDQKWVETVRQFYKPFEEDLKQAGIDMDGLQEGKLTDETCPSAARASCSRSGAASAGSWRASATPTASTRGTPATAPRRSPSRRASLRQVRQPMVYKQSRFGRFIGCSGYPECKNIKKITLGIPCPQPGCGGELTENRSKRGRAYFGCSNFPTAGSSCGSAPSPPRARSAAPPS